MNRQTIAFTYLRDCRLALIRNDLFTIQRNDHCSRLGTGRFDDVHRFTDSGTCSNHIIDDDNPAGEFCTDNSPAFTMVFDFFSVVGKGYVAPILVVQRSGGGRGQYDALVGRSEQHKIVRFVFA